MSGKDLKNSGHRVEEPAARRWKSVEAAEAAAGMRPGPPAYWEQWAELPPSERGSEIDHAIFGGIGFGSTRTEDEKYEDGAQRFLQSAHAANELAFEIRAEHVRKRDEAVVAEFTQGRHFPPPSGAVERVRARLRKLVAIGRRWDGSWFPVFQLMSGMEDFSEAEFRRPFSIESDDEAQFARLALHYRRVSEVLRFLARRSERPGRKGRPLDIDRMKMIKFARSKGLSLRQLARQIVAAGFHANRTPRPTREVLDMTVSTDDDGRVQSAKGKAVPNPAFCDEDGKPIPEGEFQRLLDDWKEEQAAVWEDRLRSAEAGQRGRQRRGQESAG